ncbi:gamma-glutamyltransferase family protein [Fervidicoccus fontis]|uniref:Gamma-glutamyltransferase n=1 Tax=Fervidicoccus fontis (strain DSM 19380 / JCM 18336 / VKM B-2539 / Kam940) TaxID=1163730 RepID=H9ZZM3_FERFK|nr:gamma-glutamyltransferase family protein [Fervidicoccus fontis]AFH42180.1 Gamma-glutamyltransferase [Fervidicoccus fontis Kam940]
MFKHPFYSKGGVVTSESAIATTIGVKVLDLGGNAIDASVATSLTLSVVLPHLGGIGGDFFALIADPSEKVHYISGSGWAPKRLSIEYMKSRGFNKMPNEGPHSIVVPGLVDGLRVMWEKFGTMEWKKLVSIVVDSLKDGFPISNSFASALNSSKEKLLEDPGSKKTYFSNKESYTAGDIFKYDGLINALILISQDPREFYEGPIAEKAVEYLNSLGGAFELSDFKEFKAHIGKPISIELGDNTIYEMPPNTQGITTLQLLKLLEYLGMSYNSTSRERVLSHLRLYEPIYAVRDAYIGDPEYMKTTVEELLSQEFLNNAIKSMKYRNTLSTQGSDTTFFSIIDESGYVVSGIQSLFTGWGSYVTEPTFEITFNKRASSFNLIDGHPNALGPRKRPFHTLSAMIIKGKERVMSLGLSGAHYRPQLHAQLYENIFRFKMNPQEALEHPRFVWDPENNLVEYEEGIDMPSANELNGKKIIKRGYPSRIGVAAIAEILENGVKAAYSDIRGDGSSGGQV